MSIVLHQSAAVKGAGVVSRYAFALATVVLATLLRWWLEWLVGPMPLFVTWYPAVLTVAVVAGGGPGILATIAAALAADYWFIDPVGFGIVQLNDLVATGIFVGTGIFLSLLAERLRRARWIEAVNLAQEQELALLNMGNLMALDMDHRIVRWSEGNRRLYGFDAHEVMGRRTSDLLQTNFGQPLERIHSELLEQGFWEGEATRRAKDGSQLSVMLHWVLRRDARGEPLAILEVSTDITSRKQAEVAVREGEERLRFALETSKIGAWDLDLTHHSSFRSLEHDRIFGYAEALPDWTYEMFLQHILPEDRAAVDEKFQLAIKNHGDWNFECRIRRADGQLRWIWAAGRHGMEGSGGARRMAGIVQDITERKLTEQALLEAAGQKQASRYARSLIESSLDPLVTISPDGKITDVNEATGKATGVPRDELVGRDFSDYFTEPEQAREGYRQVFARGFVTDYPLTIRHRNGQLMDVLYNASVYKDARGNVLGVFAAARDVTVQKQAEAELKRHRDRLEELVKARTAELDASNKDLARSNENLGQFAYVASHDLQEPLRIMASFSQLLEKRYKNQIDKDADEFIGYIVDAAGRMQKLITDLLAYSRAGQKVAEIENVDCDQVVRRVVTNMGATIKACGGSVTNDALPVIRAYEAGMIQLFQNLIGNALKFHGESPPKIHVGVKDGGKEWIFAVRDNGIGIEPQYFERIFVIFQRLHTREQYTGTGVGLSICKKIVETLGGRIWVESEVGKGTVFYFTLPKAKGENIK